VNVKVQVEPVNSLHAPPQDAKCASLAATQLLVVLATAEINFYAGHFAGFRHVYSFTRTVAYHSRGGL
jgi:hypothetical protein